MKNNKYQYKGSNWIEEGFFNIYQARNGKIYLQMGNNVTSLTLKQLEDLRIDYVGLDAFNYEDFKDAYNL